MAEAEKTKKEETRSVTPWRPFRGLTGWERDMDSMLEDFFGRRARPWWPERWSRTEEMELRPPNVDVFEEKDDIVVKAELPGMEKDNIEVNLTDHTLTIKGEKKKEEEAAPRRARARGRHRPARPLGARDDAPLRAPQPEELRHRHGPVPARLLHHEAQPATQREHGATAGLRATSIRCSRSRTVQGALELMDELARCLLTLNRT